MIPSPAELRAALLAWLGDLSVRGGGYVLHGRAGWVGPRDAAAAFGQPAMETLVYLATKKRVDRVNIAPPGLPAFWIYCINSPVAAAADFDISPPPDPKAELGHWAVVTDREWVAVEILQQAAQSRFRLRFPALEPGWRTIREVREAAEAMNQSVQAQDVYEVERLGLVHRRRGSAGAGVSQMYFYSATDHGRRVQRLVWRNPAAPRPRCAES